MVRNRLFYYTTSFPFGKGEAWKSNELDALSKDFDVTIIPLSYAENKTPVEVPDNVSVEQPLMEHETFQVKIAQLPGLLIHAFGLKFLKEFIIKLPCDV